MADLEPQLRSIVGKFVKAPGGFYELDGRFLRPIPLAVWEALPIMLRAQGDLLCMHTNVTTFMILGSSLAHGYVSKIPDPEVIFCDLPTWTVTQVYRWISRNFEVRRLAHITHQLLSKNPRRPKECFTPLGVAADILEYGNRLWRTVVDNTKSNKLQECMSSFFNTTLLRNLNKYGDFMRNVSAVVQESEGGSTNETESEKGTNSFGLLWKKLSTMVASQLPAYSSFGTFLRKTSNLHQTLKERPLNITEDMIATLFNSSVNLNWMARMNFSHAIIEDAACSRTDLRPMFHLPPTNLKTPALYQALCKRGGLLVILEAFDFTRIAKELPRLQRAELLKGDWLEHLAKNIQVIVKHFLDLTSVGSKLINRFSSSVTSEMLTNIVQVLRENTVDQLLVSLQGLLEKVEPAIEGGRVSDDMKMVLQGLRSLKSLQNLNLFNIKYRLSDLFVEPSKVAEFLRDELDLHESAVDDVMSAQLDLSQVVGTSNLVESVQEVMCNPDELKQLLRLSSNEITVENMTNTLCSLSTTQTLTVSSKLLSQVAFSKIIENFVEVGINGVLGKVNLTWNEAVGAVNALKTAPVVMPKLRKYMKVVTSALDQDIQKDLSNLNISTEGIRLLGSPTALKAFGKLLCGKKLKALAQEFELLKVSNKEPTLDNREIDDLPSEFCRTGYKQVMRMVGGPVLWGFLKPVLRGKILFAPRTAVSRAVFTEVNKTFEVFAGFVENLQSWGQGIAGLNYLKTRKDTLDKMKELLRSDSVQPIIRQVVGPDTANLLDEFDISNLGNQLGNVSGLLDLMQLVGNMSQCFELNRFHGFDSEMELELAAQKLSLKREFIAAVVFVEDTDLNPARYRFRRDVDDEDDLEPRNAVIPKHIKYKLRMDIDNVPTTRNNRLQFWRPGPRDDFIDDLRYFRGFVQYQEMIDKAIISLQTRGQPPPILPPTFLQQFPYPCFQKDNFGVFLKAMLPVIMMVCWLFLVAFLIREFVLEKELHLEELLCVMGLRPWIAWLAWFIAGLVMLSTGVAFCTAILKLGGIFPYANGFILFIFLLEYAVVVIMYCYLISCIFKTATIAALTGVILYLITFLPFVLIVSLEAQLEHWQKLLSSTLLSSGFCYGCLHIIRYEDRGIGISWDNIWYSAVPNDPMTFVWSLTMLAVDSVIYGIIGWYISNVWPANSARKQPWYFFMSLDYWGFRRKKKPLFFQSPHFMSGSLGNFFGEEVKTHGEETVGVEKCGISLRGLGVVFNKGKPLERVAVSGLTLDFMEGHITTLLGQNGAGKTTTINVLTGQIPPTSGTVFVCEKLIPDEFSEVQKFLGYCPQYNTLFSRMSVREHLRFYGELKGILHGKQLDEDVDEMLHSMGLWYMQNEQARFLSGGMQRRLCVALAFIGGSKVIILDEPTSSVDPVARRNIWDLIVKYRQGRTILLTTHHMDEADILSDKVAIIHRGKLLCHGSPLLLKSKFGCGYQLTLVRNNDVDQDSDSGRASSSCSEESVSECEDILSFVHNHVSLARLMEDNGTEMVLSLPQRDGEGHLYSFSELFRKLDESHTSLGFSSYGISSTTLEEVFLTLCGLDDNTALPVAHSEPLPMRKNSIVKAPDEKLLSSSGEKNGLLSDVFNGGGVAWPSSPLDFGCPEPVRGFRLKCQQLQALVLKRYYHLLRDWKTICSGILLPCAFIAFAMGFSLIRPSGWGSKEPALLLSPPMYGPGLKNFYQYAAPDNSPLSLIKDSIFEKPGVSVACLKDATPEARQWCGRNNVTLETDQEILTAGGLCNSPEEEARLREALPRYSKIKVFPTNTGDLVENLTDFNVNDYLLDTYVPSIERRYGGWTFLRDSTGRDVVKVWYDNTGFHATPAYLNSMSNWILKANVKTLGLDASDYGITVYNHPLQVTSEQLGRATLLNRASELGIALVVFMGFAFIPSSFIVYVVRERIQEEKRLQFVGGVGPLLYWTSAFLWDLILILIAVLISLVIILIFSLPMYVSRLNLPGVIVLLILFGFSTTPLMYLLEKLFVEPSIAFMVLYCVNIFIGVSIMVGNLILGLFSFDIGTRFWLDLMENLALVFPQYCLIGGLVEMAKNQIQSDVFAIFGQDTYESPFSMNVVLPHILAMSCEGIVFFLINLLLEVKWNSMIPKCRNKPVPSLGVSEDGDVLEERRRVESSESRDDVLKVDSARKVFHGMAGRNVAVDNVSFGIPKGECFGLLGVNGAGKTTLFRMLTGQIEPSGGHAYVAGVPVSEILSKNNEVLGYCPQADALDDLLTPEQHLNIYGKLRGIPKKELKEIIQKAMARFELKLYTNRKVGTLSRGTKRKVCTAVSMLGNPQVILLDEPTTGMDPVTRRLVWNNILQTIRDHRSVLLTSHSMEECDVLCSRLAIMVNGRIKCLGSPQYLKYKFGVGYTITLRLGNMDELDRIMDFMARCFTTAILRAHHYNMIEFSLPEKNIPLSEIFKHLEQNREKLSIKDFSISQTTLDQVFVSFARQQGDGMAESFNVKKEQYVGGRDPSLTPDMRGAYNPAFLPDGDHEDTCAIKLENLSNAAFEEKRERLDDVTVSVQQDEQDDQEATRF